MYEYHPNRKFRIDSWQENITSMAELRVIQMDIFNLKPV